MKFNVSRLPACECVDDPSVLSLAQNYFLTQNIILTEATVTVDDKENQHPLPPKQKKRKERNGDDENKKAKKSKKVEYVFLYLTFL